MKTVSLSEFAKTIKKLLDSDRYVFGVCSGEMGEGKSCFTSQLSEETAKINKMPFSYEKNMTFSRKELALWIDGDKEGKHQKPEKSSVLADELITMFFKRNWYDTEQIDGIELLNKCRDRHLFIVGNVPNFWDLDSAIYPLCSFWFHIHERGRAWVFQKDPNPFVSDKWHRKYNEKVFNQHGTPYKCKGFLCEIHFDDWQEDKKKEYYSIRNVKRKSVEVKRKTEKFSRVKKQRDTLIHYCIKNFSMENRLIAKVTGLSEQSISEIKQKGEV